MSLVSMFSGTGPSGFGYGSTAEGVTEGVNLHGRHYLLTGANSGIGQETARVLVLRGATVVAAARTVEKAKEAAAGFTGGTTIPLALELSEPASVHAAVESVRSLNIRLDGIITNAGIMALPKLEQKHGFELQFLTNHLGHFYLLTRLLDLLQPEGRVVILSSAAHTSAPAAGIEFDNLSGSRGYAPWANYGQSKLANLLTARELGRRLAGTGQVANAVHPGVISTNLGRHMGAIANIALAIGKPLFLKTIPQGAATQTWAAVHPGAGKINGEYLADCNVAVSSRSGADMALAARLWEETEKIVAAW